MFKVFVGTRRVDKHSRARQAGAAANHAATLVACADQLHPDDLAHEPANFENWMQACETGDIADVQAYFEFIDRAWSNAGGPTSATPYVLLRTHYRDYVLAAIQRRWPDLLDELPTTRPDEDVIPF